MDASQKLTKKEICENELQELLKERNKKSAALEYGIQNDVIRENTSLFLENHDLLKACIQLKYGEDIYINEALYRYINDLYSNYLEIGKAENVFKRHNEMYACMKNTYDLYKQELNDVTKGKQTSSLEDCEIIKQKINRLRIPTGLTDAFIATLPEGRDTAYTYYRAGKNYIKCVDVTNRETTLQQNRASRHAKRQLKQSEKIIALYEAGELVPTTKEEESFLANTFILVSNLEPLFSEVSSGKCQSSDPLFERYLYQFNKGVLMVDSKEKHCKYDSLFDTKQEETQDEMQKIKKEYLALQKAIQNYKSSNEFTEEQFHTPQKQNEFEATLKLVLKGQ